MGPTAPVEYAMTDPNAPDDAPKTEPPCSDCEARAAASRARDYNLGPCPKHAPDHRIFCEWDCGAYISTLSPDFSVDFARMVEGFGAPDKVEFRADGEGFVHNPPCVLALCPDCIAKIGGANPGPDGEWVECVDEPCEAADHDHGGLTFPLAFPCPHCGVTLTVGHMDWTALVCWADPDLCDPSLELADPVARGCGEVIENPDYCTDPGVWFTVVWDNGNGSGEFGGYATEPEAEIAGWDWMRGWLAEDPDAADVYSWEAAIGGAVTAWQPEIPQRSHRSSLGLGLTQIGKAERLDGSLPTSKNVPHGFDYAFAALQRGECVARRSQWNKVVLTGCGRAAYRFSGPTPSSYGTLLLVGPEDCAPRSFNGDDLAATDWIIVSDPSR